MTTSSIVRSGSSTTRSTRIASAAWRRRRPSRRLASSNGGRDHSLDGAAREVVMHCMIALTAWVLAVTPHQHAAALDTARIEQLTGAKGKLDRAAHVFKVSMPRTDLSLTVG